VQSEPSDASKNDFSEVFCVFCTRTHTQKDELCQKKAF
jgi:hypothetical protein